MGISFTGAKEITFEPQSQAFSSALETCERHLKGEEISNEPHTIIDVRERNQKGIRPIDWLPIRTGSNLRLEADAKGNIELSVVGWSSETRAIFTGPTIEKVLDRADLALSYNDESLLAPKK